jgi:hypothetical protein
MGTKRNGELPARLEAVQRRFERWRRTRKVRSRIPESLWGSAVKLAGTYGIHRTARALRVDYYALKKRVEGASVAEKRAGDRRGKRLQGASATKKRGVAASAATASRMPPGAGGATFVELPATGWPGAGECTLELEDGGGAKMRVHVKGFGALDLAALSRSFWESVPSGGAFTAR